uniref:Uncharacterized protein n=1 Tax=Pyxicephalus adspersus TaxID=30357 RepID=A0AAV3B1T1_PYXAD|nr:TPA: hypothetical protein GDO54_006646 [Pyxicephalus adspersus]
MVLAIPPFQSPSKTINQLVRERMSRPEEQQSTSSLVLLPRNSSWGMDFFYYYYICITISLFILNKAFHGLKCLYCIKLGLSAKPTTCDVSGAMAG